MIKANGNMVIMEGTMLDMFKEYVCITNAILVNFPDVDLEELVSLAHEIPHESVDTKTVEVRRRI